jgi:hypothetical protein
MMPVVEMKAAAQANRRGCAISRPNVHGVSKGRLITPVVESVCILARFTPSLRDGSFGVALSQALRARLRSHGPHRGWGQSPSGQQIVQSFLIFAPFG